jgi:hypothetical protein
LIGSGEANPSLSPTMTSAGTQAGMILGIADTKVMIGWD